MTSKIYRYKLDDSIIDIISVFGKVYDDLPNKEFKEKWDDLLTDKKDVFDKERERLEKLGYTADIDEKLYKSCRYYYRKKQPIEKKKRRPYTSCSTEFLTITDEFIKLQSRLHQDVKPSDIFTNFQDIYKDLIEQELALLSNKLKKEDSMMKIKKTFKNRCFILIKNNDSIYE
uniref:Uncharacterized protein n=1 Tax=Megaviridae environmental sample TaxID=1737588 RepID=A0A5J6VLP6_9VIRU|nr:MAG: hypothetical protein [Megaviridae environmental sample]